VGSTPLGAAPHRFDLDPAHTYPSFEADHMGISKWRGKFNRSSGHVMLDREAKSGSVEVEIDVTSVDFGLDKMNEHAVSADLFGVEAFPTAIYRGTLTRFRKGAPTRVEGKLSLHGVTQPVTLEILSFKCIPHPLNQREYCGADVRASLQRDAFGITAGQDYGFDMRVDLRIQVEALRAEDDAAK
jgi:polyisoprenoid-binding protein YceI